MLPVDRARRTDAAGEEGDERLLLDGPASLGPGTPCTDMAQITLPPPRTVVVRLRCASEAERFGRDVIPSSVSPLVSVGLGLSSSSSSFNSWRRGEEKRTLLDRWRMIGRGASSAMADVELEGPVTVRVGTGGTLSACGRLITSLWVEVRACLRRALAGES